MLTTVNCEATPVFPLQRGRPQGRAVAGKPDRFQQEMFSEIQTSVPGRDVSLVSISTSLIQILKIFFVGNGQIFPQPL